ncbi:hypothetical protein J1N35_033357 [Gossypium stocksii]|uniref:Uncharacterized protein n=1 Tax=Gossypium stocksii TaxID=47602 RepID=A0A9D3UQ14_9ROSI|nr:hypothetical protein J1N35_033357 [Gossypium stocksii]
MLHKKRRCSREEWSLDEEKDESNGNVLYGRLKSAEVERMGRNKLKVIMLRMNSYGTYNVACWEANRVSSDQDLEVVNNLGLMVVLDHNKGLEIQRKEGIETGSVEKVMRFSGNKGSPKPNPISSSLPETEEPSDWDATSEIEEGFVQLRRNRRNKKMLKKKVRSMRELQDIVLTTKEKKKRERGTRKSKGKGDSRDDESIVNLSLSDSDISNRRKVILKEAKKAWEVGKKFGFSVQGDDGLVIEELMRLEGQKQGVIQRRVSSMVLVPKSENGYLKFNLYGIAKEDRAGCRGVLRDKEGAARALSFSSIEAIDSDVAASGAVKVVRHW